ncbi:MULTISPECIES: hypothetical protein [Mycobacterium]|uniref:Transmembrane protein n=1 Tax=Mycobacterium kiyosense TaxID=2871094 RepID=A0A9P3Q7Q8_9MYCO|nr:MULTISPECIES: hypothetical protein [Mycobacterium]BDB40342.1 hypothetical protein IWGMT90018_07880 [Mycobacterium kiyosense]BDE12162.1 hypothetical protein MKCMC460_10220 [Mycobacterium sp. 20KCMC460]GLB86385.1 hypothetical protein SRL2020028_56410 [Mycobacterium kiyosense]GLB88683.1 hypothetical protein SRL2020130_15000 [Mycobacterium kiyosense]GLB95047.1 hypothetical protein SRL2020226_18230 [Mycobacterium kiyosense]
MAEQESESNPGTEPFVPDFDTGDVPVSPKYDAGEPSVAFVPNFDDTDSQPFLPLAGLTAEQMKPDAPQQPEQPESAAATITPQDGPAEPAEPAEPPGPVTVPGRYVYLKWWKFLLVLLGVWAFAAVFGLSLFYWWYHDLDKTPSVFAVFGYVVACTVAGLILAMVESKPLIAALAIAVMSAPFASVWAAAPLYGSYYCDRVTTPCLFGVLPY